MEVKSGARFVRTAPDKIRNLAGLVKGKTITFALAQLEFAGRYAAKPLTLVLKQIRAQIKDQNLIEDDMTVKELRVDEGPKLKRRRIRHQGRSTAILKRMSHITIIMSDAIKAKQNSLTEKKNSKIMVEAKEKGSV